MAGTVEVVGLAELRRACQLAGNQMSRDMNDALKSAGEPVRQDAETLAIASIPRMRFRKESNWSEMRLGIKRDYVYVAPVARSRRASRSRPNLKTKLLDEAMGPALAANSDRVEQEFRDAVRDMGKAWARV